MDHGHVRWTGPTLSLLGAQDSSFVRVVELAATPMMQQNIQNVPCLLQSNREISPVKPPTGSFFFCGREESNLKSHMRGVRLRCISQDEDLG